MEFCRILIRRIAMLGLALGVLLAPLPTTRAVHADTFTFNMSNQSAYTVMVRFYSKTRTAVWPSRTTHYPLSSRGVTKYPINCKRGERICYGATSDGVNWGVGIDNTEGCQGCCWTCRSGAYTNTISLSN